MPPKIKISEEQILDVAIQMVRTQGFESVNARSLAKELGCSIHPIFRAFDTMDKLKKAIWNRAGEIYDNKMTSINIRSDEGFHSIGMQYIHFAQTEKNLFCLLFMTNAFDNQSIMDIVDSAEGDDELIQVISQQTKLTKPHAKEVFAASWLITHGIATMFATNNCRYSDTEIERIMHNTFLGIVERLREEEKEDGN